MIKYTLQSGGIKFYPELKKQFHLEVIKGLTKTPRFLLCNFGQGREYWEAKFPGYSDVIKEDMPAGTEPQFTLAMHYWTCDWRECQDGLGILPIKFIPHYKSSFGADDPRGPIDWQKAYDQLKAYGGPDLPIVALKEGEYKVFEV